MHESAQPNWSSPTRRDLLESLGFIGAAAALATGTRTDTPRLCWNDGHMDSFVKVHTSSTYGGADGAMTMGCCLGADLLSYDGLADYGLADAFTLCDGYHSSILGPTHPNRLMANRATIDPAGPTRRDQPQTSAATATMRRSLATCCS